MITVTAATGQLGRLVIEALLARVPAEDITAAVRSPENAADLAARGVRVVRADYNDADSLKAAFAGTDRLLVISGNEFGQRVEQYQRIVDAAKAGVGFVAYTSILRADENPMYLAQDHKAAERLIEGSGIAHAFLRNGWYSENFAGTIQGAAAEGRMAAAAGEGRISSAPRADYAEAAAVVLTGAREGVFELGGSDSFTLPELAGIVAGAAERKVDFAAMTPEAYAEMLKGAGVPDGFADILADSDRYAAEGWLETRSRDLEDLLGRATVPMRETVAALLA